VKLFHAALHLYLCQTVMERVGAGRDHMLVCPVGWGQRRRHHDLTVSSGGLVPTAKRQATGNRESDLDRLDA
jgi:hypothetical protein